TGHRRAYLSAHLWSARVRAGPYPVSANIASALCRHWAYFPASLFLLLWQFWAGVAASAVPARSTAAAAAVQLVLVMSSASVLGPRTRAGRVGIATRAPSASPTYPDSPALGGLLFE